MNMRIFSGIVLYVVFLSLSPLQSVTANSYAFVPLLPPIAEDIVAFSNGLPPSTGIRKILKKDDILLFLKEGHNITDPATWPSRFNDFTYDGPCDGVIVDKKGMVYFWTLTSSDGMRLETANGTSAYLELKKK